MLSDLAVQEYVHQLGNCLMDIQQDSSSPALAQLQAYLPEMFASIMVVSLQSPKRLKEMKNTRMDTGQLCSDDRPASFYANMLVSQTLLC